MDPFASPGIFNGQIYLSLDSNHMASWSSFGDFPFGFTFEISPLRHVEASIDPLTLSQLND